MRGVSHPIWGGGALLPTRNSTTSMASPFLVSPSLEFVGVRRSSSPSGPLPSLLSASAARLPPTSLRPPFPPAVFAAIRFNRDKSLYVVQAMTEQAVSGQLEKMDKADDDVCELVSRLELTLGEGENAIDAYLVKAMKNNNGAAVLLLTDVYGYDDNDTRDFAYRLSCFGYNVLVPDLFHGMPWTKDRPMSEYEDWRVKHLPQRVLKDVNTAADWLMEEIAAAGVTKKLGLIGFCFGGGRALEILARDTQQKYATAVSFYPTRFDAVLATQINVPILLIAGDKDEHCAPDKVQHVADQIKDSQARIYPGCGHAFAHRPPSPDEDEDAEDAFLAMKSWLHEKLVSCV